jgi:glycosyltransferase involved in cell wall biosynthesis
LVTGGKVDETVDFNTLVNEYYARCVASLILLLPDRSQETAVGFTNVLEALAMGRPVIATRTGALATEIDSELEACGIYVEAGSPGVVAEAMNALANDSGRARAMGRAARELSKSRYNIDRYARDLDQFFEAL